MIRRLALLAVISVALCSGGAAPAVAAADPAVGAPAPSSWLDELDELRQRFEREMERMRAEFQREIERLNSADTTQELRRARARIEELERENAELRRTVRELRAGAGGAIGVAPLPGGADRPRGMLGVGVAAPEAELAAGFGVTPEKSVRITSVVPESPAAAMGLRAGDIIIGYDERQGGVDLFLEHMSGKRAGDEVVITYARRQAGGEILRITGRTELAAWREAAPMPPAPVPPVPPSPAPPDGGAISLGLSVEESEAGDGVWVTEVDPAGNAAAAKLAAGDRVVRFAEREVRSIDDLRAALQRARDGSEVAIRFARGDVLWQSRVRLSSRAGGAALLGGPDRVGGGDPAPPAKEPGFLGISPEERDGGLVVAEVVPGSPAAAMGILVGDRLLSLNDTRVRTIDDLRGALSGLAAGDAIRVAVRRAGERHVLEGKLAPRSTSAAPAPTGAVTAGSSTAPAAAPATSPATAPRGEGAPAPASARREPPRGVLGVSVVERDGGIFIEELPAPSAAAAAGVRVGDRIRRFDGIAVANLEELTKSLSTRRAGERVALSVERDGRPVELRVTLFAPEGGAARPAPAPSPAPPQSSRSSPAPSSPAPSAGAVPPATTAAGEPPAASAAEPPRLGIEVEERADGLWIVAIEPGLPAAAAGLRAGDRLLALGAEPVTDIASMRRAVALFGSSGRAPAEKLRVTVWREGREHRFEVSPSPR